MFHIFWTVGMEGRKRAKALGSDVYRFYKVCSAASLFIFIFIFIGPWLLYPVCWGVREGGNVIARDSKSIFYGVLDTCAKPVFSDMLTAGQWNINPRRMGLRILDFTESSVSEKVGVDGVVKHGANHGYWW